MVMLQEINIVYQFVKENPVLSFLITLIVSLVVWVYRESSHYLLRQEEQKDKVLRIIFYD